MVDKRVVSFTLSAEELGWLVRHLEAEPPAMGYAVVLDTLITAKGRLAGDEPAVDVHLSVDEAKTLHEWVFAWSSYAMAARIRRAIPSTE